MTVPEASSNFLYTIKITKSESHKGIPNSSFFFDDEETEPELSWANSWLILSPSTLRLLLLELSQLALLNCTFQMGKSDDENITFKVL